MLILVAPGASTLEKQGETALNQQVTFTCYLSELGYPIDYIFLWDISQNGADDVWPCVASNHTYTCNATNDCTATVRCAANNSAGVGPHDSDDFPLERGNNKPNT